MNVHFPAQRRNWPGRLVNLAVVVVVLALAAATFVLSYPGVHASVLQAGVSARLARRYPGRFDAVLVIACVAAVMLRDARWWGRAYAWLVIIVVVAVVGTADATHAMNVALPHRRTEGVVAAAPWVLAMLGFSLMLTMLRQSRAQHTASAPGRRAARQAAGPATGPETLAEPETSPEPETLAEPEAASAQETPLAPQGALPLPTMPAAEAGAQDPGAAGTGQPADAPAAADAGPAEEAGASGDVAPTRQEPVLTPDGAPDGELGAAAAADREAVAEHEAAEPDDALPSYDYWHNAEGSGLANRNHPATVAGQVIDGDAPPVPSAPLTVPGSVIDEDAPPFATAPFAAVPRLNRVRSTPTPPEDDPEE